MKRINRILLATGIAALLTTSCQQAGRSIDMAGEWEVALDSLDTGIADQWYRKPFTDKLFLPGTLCDAGYGVPCDLEPAMEKEVFLRLKQRFDYVGPAWYKKEIFIPEAWKGRAVFLTLERVLGTSEVWVNGTKTEGFNESLTTPHEFDLSRYLVAGKTNQIVLRIDNRKRHDISDGNLAHAYTNDTQTLWNGMLGKITLAAKNDVRIEELRLTPDIDHWKITVTVKLAITDSAAVSGKLRFSVKSPRGNRLPEKNIEVTGAGITFDYPIPEMALWDEFNPNLYKATAILETENGNDSKSETFGMRKLTNRDALLQINGRRLFLRGTLECCIFPLQGYPPTTRPGWEKVFRAARDYGLNHLRFHSWCPPEAAFEVADSLGFYLQIELPVWSLNIGEDRKTVDFLYGEASRILKEYGNHPSFCFWSLGNELQGDFRVLNELLTDIKRQDNRRLYTTTTFTFEPGHGTWPEPDDDFWVTQWTKNGWVRGQGIFDNRPVRFDQDYSGAVAGSPVPLVTHEIGQYSIFPDLKETGRYTGNLVPLNFKAVAEDLKEKKRLHAADDYLQASGQFAVILYKEEIERALKTPGLSGFQLLDLQDFPGQGTALVGVLNAFWESKGLIAPEEFRCFCSPVVPLARFEKATYTNDETFEARFEAANFLDKELKAVQPAWSLSRSDGTVVAQGKLDRQDIPVGNGRSLGSVAVPLQAVASADRLTLAVRFGEDYRNSWNIWVYPADTPSVTGELFYTRSFHEAEKALEQGKKVLLNPEKEEIKGLEGKFVPVFWSPVHFPDQPGTMGVLCDPAHPAFARFPTEAHSDWQWQDICKNAVTMELDSIKDSLQPIVGMIDNFYKNRNLGLAFEAKVGNGKLLVCSADLATDPEERPVARQLRYSLLHYMASGAFEPETRLSFEKIRNALHTAGKR